MIVVPNSKEEGVQQDLRGQCHQNTRGWVVEVVGGNDGETIDHRLAIDAEHAGMCTLNQNEKSIISFHKIRATINQCQERRRVERKTSIDYYEF